MNDTLEMRYSKLQLEHILEEAMIYMCACPAQVAEQLLSLRKLFVYQKGCLSKDSLLDNVHHRISEATRKTHAEMELCLHDVLQMEGWDPQTLTMPAGLRQLRQQTIDQG
jgi:hypothetical protein